jgi:hypothetical protein
VLQTAINGPILSETTPEQQSLFEYFAKMAGRFSFGILAMDISARVSVPEYSTQEYAIAGFTLIRMPQFTIVCAGYQWQ